MDAALAWSRLRDMVQASSAPSLSDAEVESLLHQARRADTYGLAPNATGWTPSYNLNAAAAEGWRRKAGKVAGEFDFSTDGQSFSRSQQYRACLDMAAQYARKASASVSLAGGGSYACTDIAGNVNSG
jgi:hypothetical protein